MTQCLTDFGCDSWELEEESVRHTQGWFFFSLIMHMYLHSQSHARCIAPLSFVLILPRPCQLNTDERVLFNQSNILSSANRQGCEDSMNKI